MPQNPRVFQVTAIRLSVLIACGLGWGGGQSAWAQTEGSLQRVEVTGSLIKRVAGEGANPVETISRKEIERTGATTVNELLRHIPSIDIADSGELASNSPAGSGTASIGMRGLGDTQVLVLLNGRRLPVNALYDSSGAGAAVDINMIPIGAIERIEILKDGGSAIYGADAVAGVVNFITKKNYQGLEAFFDSGISSRGDGKETSMGLSGGYGDLDTDNFNILFAINSFQRDPILRKDREISKSVDFRRLGGSDGRSSFSPYGNYVDNDTFGWTGETFRACPTDLYNGRCRYDFNASLLTAYNGADRLGGLVVGTFKLGSDLKGFAEVSYSQSKNHFEAHPVPDYFAVNGGANYIGGRFMQGGPRISDREASSSNFVVGLEGTHNQIDWNVALGQGVSTVTNRDKNYYNGDLWLAATESGALDPTVSTNDAAFVESLKVKPLRVGESKTQHLDVKLTGEFMKLTNGPLAYAVGMSAWNESLVDTPDKMSQDGNVVGSIAQAAVDASRSAKAVFAELSIPAMKDLEVQLAARYDQYDTANKLSPKVALRYEVSKAFMLRSSYSESFKMPALKQLFGAKEQGAININNESGAPNCQAIGLAADCDVSAWQVNGANTALKPEKGVTWNLGAAFEAGSHLSGTVDFWRIDKTDNISTPTLDEALRQGLFGRDPADNRWLVFTNLSNQAMQATSGVDVDLRSRFPNTALGTISLRNSTTFYFTNSHKETATSEWINDRGNYASPELRNNASISIEQGPWVGVLGWRFTGGFKDAVEPTATTMSVPAYEEFDFSASYTGFKNLKLNAGVKNLLDAQPPYSKLNGADNTYTQMGFAEIYNSRGRYMYASLNYVFK